MISIPSSFGEVGSWAVYARPGARHAARILALSTDASVPTATISLADVPFVSTGTLDVPLAALRDPTPLTRAELTEMEELCFHLLSLARPERSTKAPRAEQLRHRSIDARWLIGELQRINRFRSIATRATREAQRHFEALQAEAAPAMGAAA